MKLKILGWYSVLGIIFGLLLTMLPSKYTSLNYNFIDQLIALAIQVPILIYLLLSLRHQNKFKQ